MTVVVSLHAAPRGGTPHEKEEKAVHSPRFLFGKDQNEKDLEKEETEKLDTRFESTNRD